MQLGICGEVERVQQVKFTIEPDEVLEAGDARQVGDALIVDVDVSHRCPLVAGELAVIVLVDFLADVRAESLVGEVGGVDVEGGRADGGVAVAVIGPYVPQFLVGVVHGLV